MDNETQKNRGKYRKWLKKRPRLDNEVQESIARIEQLLRDSMEPVVIRGLNGFQRKQVHQHLEKTQEYKAKTYRENSDFIMKVYPVGKLRRLAEQKAQEVIMKGESEILPPMGSFERFIIHDYLKDREGVKTESFGQGKDRHVEISPLFGRNPKKAKRKLTR